MCSPPSPWGGWLPPPRVPLQSGRGPSGETPARLATPCFKAVLPVWRTPRLPFLPSLSSSLPICQSPLLSPIPCSLSYLPSRLKAKFSSLVPSSGNGTLVYPAPVAQQSPSLTRPVRSKEGVHLKGRQRRGWGQEPQICFQKGRVGDFLEAGGRHEGERS